MTYVLLPEQRERTASFYLAMEEHVARRYNTGDDLFFMWQVQPTVVFGRNQLIESEVNIPYCREHGIQLTRRKSGGGCVYADMSNVMFSYITRDERVNFTFNHYISMIALTLAKLGVDAHASGRNDILIGGKKVSGNAFYHIPGHSIVHGTMLYDTDMQNMIRSITPSDEKLVSKGVNSVRQHIALLKDYISISIDEFKDFIRQNLCDGEIKLGSDDVAEIERRQQEYLTDEFLYGSNPRYTAKRHARIEGVGDFEARLELKNNIIRGLDITGDYFLVGDIDEGIIRPLMGKPLSREAIEEALPERIDDVVLNLKKEDFIKFILNTL